MDVRHSGSATDLARLRSVFLSPPWGGVDYQKSSAAPASAETAATAEGVEEIDDTLASAVDPDSSTATRSFVSTPYSLTSLKPISGAALVQLCLRHLRTPNLVLYIPRNTEPSEIAKLGKMVARESGKEDLALVQIEEEFVGKGMAALTCYFGELASFEE